MFEWQEFTLEGMLGIGEDGRFVSVDDGVCVARQNGKGVVLQALELFVAFELGHRFGYDLVMHTAHEFSTAKDHQYRLMGFVQDTPSLHGRVAKYLTANGQESIRLKDGTVIAFKARTKGGARGVSGDLLVWDEAMVIPEAVVGAQKPTTRASQAEFGQKTVYAGSAVDEQVHEHGVMFARIRERGIAGSPRLSWVEWSAPFDDPSEMTDEVLADRANWHAANPSMSDGLISEQTMQDEIEVMPRRVASVELFGVSVWPRTDGLDESVISIEDWDGLEEPTSRLDLDRGWCLGFDVSPERHTSIAFAGWNESGEFHVEVQESRPGTGWSVEWITRAVERGQPDVVVCDGVGPAASLIVPLKEAGVTVEPVTTSEHGQACGRLVDMVAEKTLRHLGSSELRDAVRGARRREVGEVWLWSRRNSSVNIAPLVAGTLALGAAVGVAGGGKLVIW